jgi:hypothetical protein
MRDSFIHCDQDTVLAHGETEQAGVRYLLVSKEPLCEGSRQRTPIVSYRPKGMPGT